MAIENKPLLRHLKGWKGYVWNYNKMMEAFDKHWHLVKWGTVKPKEEKKVQQGAVEKTIIKF